MASPLTLILDVRFYTTKTGAEPVRDWLRSLPHDIRKIIGDDIKTVQLGWPIGMPLVRNLASGLWEVRISLPDRIARVLFTTDGPMMVLVHGFIKKTQQTPKQDLELARKRMKEVRHG
jgi:phage-related protein